MPMNLETEMEFSLDQHLGCFGKYRSEDLVCRQKCALNLRCSIEREQNERYELLEELVSASGMAVQVN